MSFAREFSNRLLSLLLASLQVSMILFAPIANAGAPSIRSCLLSNLESGLLGPSTEEAKKLAKTQGDFFSLTRVSSEQAARLNANVLESLRAEPIPQGLGPRRKPTFSTAEVKKLYRDIASNRQVSESLCGGYRGSEKTLGFCFGRAFIAHLKALQAGVTKRSIRKVWAVGNLKSGSTSWRYHVTTIVRMNDGDWYALDPIFDRPMPVSEWFKIMGEKYDPSGTLRFFSTEASRYHAGAREKYSPTQLAEEFLHGFFVDFMETFVRENAALANQRSQLSTEHDRTLFLNNLKRYLRIATHPGVVAGAAGAAGVGAKLYSILNEDTHH